MNDYMLLMYDDVPDGQARPDEDWAAYFAKLRAAGVFQGGSSIGDGITVSKTSTTTNITRHISGYIRVRAADLDGARELVAGNPVYEAGGTIEVRELPKDR